MKRAKLPLLLLPLIISCAYDTDESLSTVYNSSGVIINEVLTQNSTGISDEFGEREDWIELKNSGDQPVSLEGFYLSDDPENLNKWAIGDTLLKPGEYLLLFASGRDISYPAETPNPVYLPISFAYSWCDSDDGFEGSSWVRPYKSDDYISETGGKNQASASIFLADNAGTLGWQSAEFVLNMDNMDNIDFSGYNTLEFAGYISENRNLHVTIGKSGWASGLKFYQGVDQLIEGEGDATYRVQLNLSNTDSAIDLTQFETLNFRNKSVNDTVSLLVKDLRLLHSGYSFHSSFKLSPDGEALYLSNPDGDAIDSMIVPKLSSDISYGRDQNGRSALFSTPTPGSENSAEIFTTLLEKPAVVTVGGFYRDSVYVELASDGAELFYTVDGSLPDRGSAKYSAPILLKETTTLRVASYRIGSLSPHVSTETYFINEETSLPVLSLTVDPADFFDPETGLYMPGPKAGSVQPYFGANFWDADRVEPGHISFFEPAGSEAFSRDVGIKIHGGYSRGQGQKSLALMFNDEFDEGWLEYPVFPDYPHLKRFKSLILRTGGQHVWDFALYDGFNSSLMKDRGLDYQKMRPAQLFINGKYWGMYNIREKLNEHFFTSNHGIDGDEINLVKDGGIIQSGSADEYIKLENFVNSADMSLAENYNYVESQMDIYNYIDYLCTEIFIVNQDWPANNIKWWKQRTPGSKWRWVLYDTDGASVGDASIQSDMIGFLLNDDSSIDYPNGPHHTVLFRKLLDNRAFKETFINRLLTLLNTNFSPKVYRSRLAELEKLVGDEYKRCFSRWGYYESDWRDQLSYMENFPEVRAGHVRDHLHTHLDAGEDVQFSVSSSRGELFINGMSLNSADFSGIYLDKTPISLSLTGAEGFDQWSDGNRDTVRVIELTEALSLRAQFK